ncbi:MAG: DUF192 domain-containing protein [Pseudomonadota bacterium]
MRGLRLAVAAIGMFAAACASALETFETAPLTIETAGGPVVLTVELADSRAQQRQGLMFRRSLPEDAGMLFDYRTPRTIQMWMRNTFIPLDMIFIGVDGRVVDIAERATPLSEEIIASRAKARAVLEVNGGAANRWGVAIGDRVVTPRFGGEAH